jgi:hypothetical protein
MTNEQMKIRLKSLEKALEISEKDADRYRWLKECGLVNWLSFLEFSAGQDVDVAIDFIRYSGDQ